MALAVGDLLKDRYRVLEHLGRGSWGDVYLVKDQKLSRQVAIKCLRQGSVRSQADIERFLTEARTIANIRDENVVTIYDVGEESEDGVYLILEYADEGSVADLLQREERLPVLRALEIGLAAIQALEVVHAKGILHGDIKPSNILLVRNRERIKAKLTDFGLSRVITSVRERGYAGSILYAAPEQLREEVITGHADLYALGAVLYEMLTGQPPFPYPDEIDQVIEGHLKETPAPPSQRNPDVSPVVDEVVLKALSKHPDERYPDARTMGQALHQAVKDHRDWQERLESTFAQGLKYEERQEWEQAAVCYETVLAEQTGHTKARQRLALVGEKRDWAQLYQDGLQAYEQGAWEQAEKTLSQVVAHDGNYAGGDAAAKLAEARRQLELAQWYKEAQAHEAEERWPEAVNLYLKILTQESDYGDVSSKLAHAVQQQKRQALYSRAREHVESKAWGEAVKTLQELERVGPDYKDSATLLAQARRQKRLHELYNQAVQALNEGEWGTAAEAFAQVLQMEPEYEDAAVKRAIAERQARLAELYGQARTHIETEEWASAAEALHEIGEMAPAYQDVDHLLAEVLQKQHVADLYGEGKRLREQGEWEQAIQRWEEVRRLSPGYRDVEQILKEAQEVQRIHVLYDQARQFEVEEQWTEAISVYSEILNLDANHRDAKVGLARVSAAALGKQPEEHRERKIAITGALMVIAALSCMLLQPLLGMAENVFATPTPERYIAALTATAGESTAIAKAATVTADAEATRTAAGLQATADAATVTAVAKVTANAEMTATADAASATAVALATTAKAEATETADATITSDRCWEDNFDNNSINSGCWVTTVASTDPPTGLTVEDGRVRVTRALSYTSSWSPSSSLQSRQWVDINHPNTFAEWKTTIHSDSSWAILKMHLIDPDHRRALTIDCSDSDSAENFDCALVMWDTTLRTDGWRSLQSVGGMSFTLNEDYAFKLARNDVDRHIDLYVDGELEKSVDFTPFVWGNMDRAYVRWDVHHWDSSRCTYSATYPCGAATQIDVSLDHIKFGTPQIESVHSLPIPNSNTLLAGTPFTKSWRIETGFYPWSQGYRLVHKSGHRMRGREQRLPNLTGVHTITLPLVAPDEPQDYASCWTIADAAGRTISKTLSLCAEISVCVPQVELVDHWTLPGGPRFSPGVSFTANWLLRNPSDCPWPEGSRLVFVSGDQMSGPDEIEIEELPAFSETITVSLKLVAPTQLGEYEGMWQIMDGDGEPVGETYSVRISVVEPPATASPLPQLMAPEMLPPCSVELSWTWSGTLAADEYFAVHVGPNETEPESVTWIKDFSYQYSNQGEACWHRWEVAVCRGDPDDPRPDDCRMISEEGERFWLNACRVCNCDPSDPYCVCQ